MRNEKFGFSLDLFLEVSPQNSFNPKGWVRSGGVSVRYLLGWELGGRNPLMLHVRSSCRTCHPFVGTQRPPSRSGCQQTARGRGRILAGPNFGLCPKPSPCCHGAKALPGFRFYCSKLSWMKWGCPPPASPGGGLWAGPAPRAAPVAPAFLRWDPNSCSRAHLQGQGTNCCLHLSRSHLPLASPPPKTPRNASKNPQGLGNQTWPALGSSLES